MFFKAQKIKKNRILLKINSIWLFSFLRSSGFDAELTFELKPAQKEHSAISSPFFFVKETESCT